jgi:hypothetical protein
MPPPAHALEAGLVVRQAAVEGAQVVGVELLVVDELQLLERHRRQPRQQLPDRAQAVPTRVLEIDQGVVEVEEDRLNRRGAHGRFDPSAVLPVRRGKS